ncbi:MAG TPA: aldehyde dehydrogenase family protein, partial [Acidimicrobiales bacterium]|nr:aldehyde dehydrogenase family protein [Acidimicrobiales bacterium]
MADYQLFINGEYVDAQSGETFTTIDPGTGQPIAEIAKAGREDSVRAIEAARKAFDEGPWPRMSGPERGAKLNEIADAIEAKAGAFAEMEARDGGGTIKKATFADVPGAVGAFRWFAKLATEEAEEIEVPGTPFPPSQNWVRYEPHGVCTGVIPWNFPFIMA